MATTGGRPPLTSANWHSIIDQYVRLRDLERPDFLREVRQLIEDLRGYAATLLRYAVRLEIRARPPDVDLADFGASAIRRRLAVASYGPNHLRFTDGFLDRLLEQIAREQRALRRQAWWLDVAAENIAVWIEVQQERQEQLREDRQERRRERHQGRQEQAREHAPGRPPSVGLDYLIGATLACGPSEIAEQLVEAGVLPERESEDGDALAQWKQHLRRARARYRRQHGV